MVIIGIERTGAAVVSQASNSRKEYERLLAEKDKYKAEAETAKKEVTETKEELAKLKDSEEEMKARMEKKYKECIQIFFFFASFRTRKWNQ